MRAELLNRISAMSRDPNLAAEVQQTLIDCYKELATPIAIDVVVAERMVERMGQDVWLYDVAGVFTSSDRANTISHQLNSDKDSPWLSGIIRTALDMPRRMDEE